MRIFNFIAFGLAIATGTVRADVPTINPIASCAKPVWPKKSLQNEETGVVELAFLIGEDGVVKDARVDQTSGAHELDMAALNAISKCKFAPTVVDGKPVERWQKMEYWWVLVDEESSAQSLLQKQNYRGAAKMLRKSAEKGRATAQFKLAILLSQGTGVNKDPEEARTWLKKSASQSYAPAMGAYGTDLLQQGGADQEALMWLQDGAAHEDVNSMYMLGACYEDGRGVPADLEKAKYWYGRAAEKGHADASAALKELNQASK